MSSEKTNQKNAWDVSSSSLEKKDKCHGESKVHIDASASKQKAPTSP
jgi:hypothetical protein